MAESTIVAVVVAAFAALPPTLVALAGLRQGQKNGEKAAHIEKTAAEIHVLTNSNLTKVTADLALANQRIEELQVLIAKLMENKNS